MGLLLGFDRQGIDPRVADELDQILASIQTWAGKSEGLGKWTDVPYSAVLFGQSAGVWTVEPGDMQLYQYTIVQDMMFVRLILFHTTTSAAIGPSLYVSLPDGWRCRDNHYIGVVEWDDDSGGGTYGTGTVLGTLGSTGRRMNIVRDVLPSSTNWPIATNTLSLRMNLTVPVIRE